MTTQTHQAVHDQEQENIILDMLDKFLAVEVKPHVHRLEHDDIYPTEIVEKMKEMGLFGCLIAPEYGGWACPLSPMPRSLNACPASGCPFPASSIPT